MNERDDEHWIKKTIGGISSLDGKAQKAAAARMDALLKPPGSLGRLEEIGIKMAGIQRTEHPKAERFLSMVFAADHGVTAEGVSASPPEVTAIMTRAFCSGKAGVNVLADCAGAAVHVVDVGVASPYEEPDGLIVDRVRSGTANMRLESAMSRREAAQAVRVGIETTRQKIQETGAQTVGIGEMGIGNTTSASALVSVFTGADPAQVTGGGTGIGQSTRQNKVRVIRDALERSVPDSADPLGVLSEVGGLEIAAMCGAMLGGAAEKALVLVDGFISGAAALAAFAMVNQIRDYMILSHMSAEPGHRFISAKLGIKPFLDMGFRLGEGTGSAVLMPMIRMGDRLLDSMGTLEEELVHLAAPE